MSQNNSADLWIQAMQNVSRQVYDLQLAEYRRLLTENAPHAPTLLTHDAEARTFVKGRTMGSRFRRDPSNPGAWGAFHRNGWEYPHLIKIIKEVRDRYRAGLKESKDLVEDVISTLP